MRPRSRPARGREPPLGSAKDAKNPPFIGLFLGILARRVRCFGTSPSSRSCPGEWDWGWILDLGAELRRGVGLSCGGILRILQHCTLAHVARRKVTGQNPLIHGAGGDTGLFPCVGHPCSLSSSHWIFPREGRGPPGQGGGAPVGLHRAGSCLQNRVQWPFLRCCTALTSRGASQGARADSLWEQGWAIWGALSGGWVVALSRAPSCTPPPCTLLPVGINPPVAIGEHCTGAGHLLWGRQTRRGWIKSSCMGSHGTSPCKPAVHRAGHGAGELMLALRTAGHGGC